ncbi:hypothetical protein [Tenuifilum thalassicum]|uniref:Uncharacterized protein n=1 Tax=Tenuifilum thalassicum TaxID=2590900 RepID=A0A7D4BQS3_9BACT|nr:hypothetical protein [Tenuifilum thalassicum]QKG79081.1 hypothetical protein FHG85_01975 [Tenuifilum thalassicum]
MKKITLLTALVLLSFTLMAQDIEKGNKIPSTYDRSSLTVFFMKFSGEKYVDEVENQFPNISLSDKYYNNNLDIVVFDAPFSRSEQALNKAIESFLIQKDVPKSIISKWYNRKEDGSMDLNLVFDRGMFNATDAQYIKAQATKRGENMLKDYGNRLVGKSYILVLDYKNIKNLKKSGYEKMRGWNAVVDGYLYKIKFDLETQNALYDCWIYPEDTPEIRQEKINKFKELNIPIEFVTKTTVNISASQPTEDTTLGKLIKQKSEEELFEELVQKGYDETLYYLERKHEDFMVKTTIYQVHPIRAKIGLKEGLKCDHRYFAYEYVYNEKTNRAEPKFRGVIRATSKIVDNRKVAKGDTPTSKFYQTAGRKLHEGYLLRQQNDIGLEVLVGYEAGEVGGVYGRIDYRTGRFTGVKALFIYLEGGIDSKDYPLYDAPAFVHYGAGLAKGFMLTRNLELRPYVGLGQELATHEDFTNGSLKALYLKGGANLALNLKHNFQVMFGMGSYSFIGNAEDDDGDTGLTWNDYFEGRSGAATMFGIKLMF